MRVAIYELSRSFPVTVEHNKIKLEPKLEGINFGVKTRSNYKFNVGYDSQCNRCGTKVRSVKANRSTGYILLWDCKECGYSLLSASNSHFTIQNNPVKWYTKLWWQFKVGLRSLKR